MGMGLDSKRDFSPTTIFLVFSFAFRYGVSLWVGSNILLSMVVQQQIVILEFSQEKMSTSFYSAILPVISSR